MINRTTNGSDDAGSRGKKMQQKTLFLVMEYVLASGAVWSSFFTGRVGRETGDPSLVSHHRLVIVVPVPRPQGVRHVHHLQPAMPEAGLPEHGRLGLRVDVLLRQPFPVAAVSDGHVYVGIIQTMLELVLCNRDQDGRVIK